MLISFFFYYNRFITLEFHIKPFRLGLLVTLNQTIRRQLLDLDISARNVCTCNTMTIPLGTFYFFTVLDKALCVLCDLMCLKFFFWLISMFFFLIYALTYFILLMNICWIWMNVLMHH